MVQVGRKDGSDAWVLVHIEVQSEAEIDFAERMYVYNYRIYDRFHPRVASLAVLTDQSADWRQTGSAMSCGAARSISATLW